MLYADDIVKIQAMIDEAAARITKEVRKLQADVEKAAVKPTKKTASRG